jgi:hypothetical protein
MTEDERLTIYNNVFPIGSEVRYFTGNTEEEAALLQPGQPYLVHPKRFGRLDESRVKVTETSLPLRKDLPDLVPIKFRCEGKMGNHSMSRTMRTIPL